MRLHSTAAKNSRRIDKRERAEASAFYILPIYSRIYVPDLKHVFRRPAET